MPTSPRPRTQSICFRIARGAAAVASALVLAVDAFAQSAASTGHAVPLDAAIAGGNVKAAQKAIAILATQPGDSADRALIALFDRYLDGKLPASLWLDLFEAAAQRANPELKARLAAQEKKSAASRDPLARYRECLEGGDAQAGREIFTKSPVANCVRCHRIENEGAEIGPNLTVMRQVTDRIFILESIVDPNTTITAGFSHVLLTLKDGKSVSGLVASEDNDEVTLTSIVDGKKHTVPRADIVERTALPSAMPPGFAQILGKRALRDVVEFLASPE